MPNKIITQIDTMLEAVELQIDGLVNHMYEATTKAEMLRQWAKKDGPKNYQAYVTAVGSDNAIGPAYWHTSMKSLGVPTDAAAKKAAAGKIAPKKSSRGMAGAMATAQPDKNKITSTVDCERWLRQIVDNGQAAVDYALYHSVFRMTTPSSKLLTEEEFTAALTKVRAEKGLAAKTVAPKAAPPAPKKDLTTQEKVSQAAGGSWNVEPNDNGGFWVERRDVARGARQDHSGRDDGSWMNDQEIASNKKPFEDKWKSTVDSCVQRLKDAGFKASGYVDYDEKGWISLIVTAKE
jgi:hypothetical protein